MRNLFLLLWRNNFTILFLLLQSLSIYFLIRNNRFQQVSVFNSTNAVVGSIMGVVSEVTEYINLKENNENLSRENARLKALLPESYYENRSVRTMVADSSRSQKYSYIAARVINNSVNKRNNFLTLDKGSLHGVHPDMGVISSTGIVGIVKDVSEHYCTVMSLLHKNSKVSARFNHNNYFGSLSWDGDDPRIAQLSEIPKHVVFKIGDTLVTTRYSAIFPEGVMIGTVRKSNPDMGGNFHDITVNLSTEFSNISHVYIVDNLMKSEQNDLESKTESEDDK